MNFADGFYFWLGKVAAELLIAVIILVSLLIFLVAIDRKRK